MNNKKSTIINACAALITFVVQIFISFWLSPFVVSRLGEEAYGFINLANNFVSYASLITVMINSMASRYISVEYNSGRKEEAKKYYSTVFIANCFLFLFVIAFAVLLISKLEMIINISEQLVFQVKISFLLSFINMGISLIGTVYTSATFTTNKMHYNSIIQIISNIIKSIFIFILFTIFPAKIYYFSGAVLIAGVVTLVGNYCIAKKLFEDFYIKINFFSLKKLVVLIKSGVWVLISNVSNLLLSGLDLLFSNWFINTAIMGRLSLAKQIPYAFSSALGIFSNIFSSSLTKAYISEGKNGLIDEVNTQLKILTIIFTVPYAGIIAFGRQFLNLWLNNANYTAIQLNEIYLLMLIILFDIIISTYMYSIHSVFIALDKVKVYSVVLLIASVISVSVTLLLLNFTSLGVFAIAATSTVVLGFTHGVIVPALASKLLNESIGLFFKTEMKSWSMLVLISIVFGMISKIITISGWIEFFAYIFIAGILGYILTWIIAFNKKEKENIINLFRAKIDKIF